MRDVTLSGPIVDRHALPLCPKRPKRSADWAFGAMAKVVAQAFCLAYVAPYQGSRPAQPTAEVEDGRDPSW